MDTVRGRVVSVDIGEVRQKKRRGAWGMMFGDKDSNVLCLGNEENLKGKKRIGGEEGKRILRNIGKKKIGEIVRDSVIVVCGGVFI